MELAQVIPTQFKCPGWVQNGLGGSPVAWVTAQWYGGRQVAWLADIDLM